MDILTLLDFAKKTVKKSGDMIFDRQFTAQASPKGDHDFVTEVDFASQEFIIDTIQKEYPDHGFLAEERTTRILQRRKYTWVVDPIDGTVNYVRKRPIYCVSLGLMIEHKPTIGVVYNPINKELFSAASGYGFYINDTQFQEGSPVSDLYDAAIASDWDVSPSLRLKTNEKIKDLILQVQTIQILGSVALALAWVASGRLDAYFKFEANAWDIVAGAVMIREGGGMITHHNNHEWDWRSKDKSLLASNGVLHKSLLEHFR